MPEAAGQAQALERLDREIADRWGAEVVPPEVLAKRFPLRRKLLKAWRLPGVVEDGQQDLLVMVDSQFPWSLPMLALPEATNGVSFPHVEADGHLCLVPDVSSFALPVGVEHVEQLVKDANDLLHQGRSGANDDEFYSEAQSYWSLVAPSKDDIWLTAPLPPTHAVWSSALPCSNIVIAPDRQAIKSWAASCGRKVQGLQPALILRCPYPLLPEVYPLTMRDLFSFAKEIGAAAELQFAITHWPAQTALPVVIAFDYDGKDILLGAAVLPPGQIRMPEARGNGVPGFRHGSRMTAKARLAALSQVPLRFPHLKVIPVYRQYLHTRTAGESSESLASMHVIIAGCGAIGGQLAVQLAQAGVGRLTLLDDEMLDWRNVGRHVLDGSYVGRYKALAVAQVIQKRFPGADVLGVASNWETCWKEGRKEFETADLMISVTGEAASNLYLDALARDGEVPPVIFGWLEPFGVAAHAVFRHPHGGGLSSITTTHGALCEPVADLGTLPQLPQEPSCGAFYQPYSSLSALPGIALIGELSLDALLERVPTSTHRIWVGNAGEFSNNGLSLNGAWHTRLNQHGYNRRFDIVLPNIER